MDLQTKFILSLLRPGDILLYDTHSLFGYLIKVKRGEKYTHIEVYIGDNKSVASRDGVGVGKYDLRLSDLAAIYRTKGELRLEQGMEWFKTVEGQKYDWLGLLSFAWAKFRGLNNNKMFCSEFVTRFLRACGIEPFNRDVDADAVSPELITYSDQVFEVWLRKDKRKTNE
jgi:hypothetical protein